MMGPQVTVANVAESDFDEMLLVEIADAEYRIVDNEPAFVVASTPLPSIATSWKDARATSGVPS